MTRAARRSAGLSRCGAVAAALLVGACSRAETAPTNETPSKATTKAPKKVATKVFQPVDAKTPQTVAVGTRFDLQITSPAGGAKKYTFRAEITGTGVTAEGSDTTAPPAADDGGRYVHDFHFVATAKGAVKITLVPSNDAGDAVTFDVTVTGP